MKGTRINQAFPSLHEGSLEITLSVPLRSLFLWTDKQHNLERRAVCLDQNGWQVQEIVFLPQTQIFYPYILIFFPRHQKMAFGIGNFISYVY